MQSEQTLSKQQKESVFLLQIGTFLEYFDLMLYVHMAVLLGGLWKNTQKCRFIFLAGFLEA
jgi:hypothetical protein